MKSAMKRYNLVIPHALYDEVKALADQEDIPVLELLRRFIRLGLVLFRLLSDPETALLVRIKDSQTGVVKEREIILL